MKRLFKLTFVILFLLLIVACSSESNPEKNSVQVTTEKHPDTDQQYSIINTFDLHNSFFSQITDDLQQNEVSEIYKKEVIDPIYDRCFAGGEYVHMADFLIESPPMDEEGVLAVVESSDREKLNASIMESLIRSSEYLPTSEETTVCIFPTKDQDVPIMIAIGDGKIIVLYNDEYPDDLIQASIAHEYHHIIWTERNPEETQTATVLDNLIFEGKAVMFEKTVFPDKVGIPIDNSYTLSFWEMIEDDLHKTDLNRTMEILTGDGALPYAYGYSEGYKMVKSYLDKYPNLAPEDWIDIEPLVIFEEGEYLVNY